MRGRVICRKLLRHTVVTRSYWRARVRLALFDTGSITPVPVFVLPHGRTRPFAVGSMQTMRSTTPIVEADIRVQPATGLTRLTFKSSPKPPSYHHTQSILRASLRRHASRSSCFIFSNPGDFLLGGMPAIAQDGQDS